MHNDVPTAKDALEFLRRVRELSRERLIVPRPAFYTKRLSARRKCLKKKIKDLRWYERVTLQRMGFRP